MKNITFKTEGHKDCVDVTGGQKDVYLFNSFDLVKKSLSILSDISGHRFNEIDMEKANGDSSSYVMEVYYKGLATPWKIKVVNANNYDYTEKLSWYVA